MQASGYANLEAGWRFRLENSENGLDPGDEFLFLAEAGVHLPWGLMIRLAGDGQVGLEGSLDRFGASTVVPRRRLYSVWTGLHWRSPVGLNLELAARFLLAGEDFPAGVQIFTAMSYQFQLWGKPL